MIDFHDWKSVAQSVEIDALRHSYMDVWSPLDDQFKPTLVLLHGYPTWGYDWVDVMGVLSVSFRVIVPDWIGYGLSDKPDRHIPITEQIDRLHSLLDRIGVKDFHLAAHDYGATCAQEILDRPDFAARVKSLTLMNGGLVFEAYRPTRTQKLLLTPIGPLISKLFTKDRLRTKLDAVRRHALTDAQWDALWAGMNHDGGMSKAHLLQRYINERAEHHPRWDAALRRYSGPVQLVWGPLDPISGAHVLAPLRERLPKARVTELEGVGHFVPDEAPKQVADALLTFIRDQNG